MRRKRRDTKYPMLFVSYAQPVSLIEDFNKQEIKAALVSLVLRRRDTKPTRDTPTLFVSFKVPRREVPRISLAK